MATLRRGWDPAALAIVEARVIEGWTPSEIHRDLEKMRAAGDLAPDAVPDLRTIQRHVKAMRPPDPTGVWRFGPDGALDDGFTLSVLAEVVLHTRGRLRDLSNRSAAWIRAIHAVAADLEPWTVYTVASMYVARASRDLDSRDLDLWLACGPWRGPREARRYEEGMAAGVIPSSPIAMNWASRVIIAAAALSDEEGSARRSIDMRSVDGLPVDPEIYDELREVAARRLGKKPQARRPR